MSKKKILVKIKANGGWDGDNMVLSLNNEQLYREKRGALAIPYSKAIKIRDDIGLHPALEAFANFFKEGKLSIIRNVGMAANDFSHFRSSDIYHTASNPDEILEHGYIGRALDLTDNTLPYGITAGNTPSLAMRGKIGNSINVQDVNALYDFDDNAALTTHDIISFMRSVQVRTEGFLGMVKKAADRSTSYSTNSPLGKQLSMISRLINGGLETIVYYAHTTGFDTHAGQVNSGDSLTGLHTMLMMNLAKDISDFLNAVPDHDVTVLVYSEFGRTVKPNASFGTDHGNAAPMFVFSNNIDQQIIGSTPDLSGDVVPHEFDFRQVYASILQHIGFDQDVVLLRKFEPLQILKSTVIIDPPSDVEAQFVFPGGRYTLFTNNTFIRS